MLAAQKGVADTCAKGRAAIDKKFKEARPSLLPSFLSFLFPLFMDGEALEEMRKLEDQYTKKWHPQLSSVKPLVRKIPGLIKLDYLANRRPERPRKPQACLILSRR